MSRPAPRHEIYPYAPNFPTVQIAHSATGLMASPGQLQSMGLVAEPEKPSIRSNKWPS